MRLSLQQRAQSLHAQREAAHRLRRRRTVARRDGVRAEVDGVDLRFWPSSVMAFHFGVRAIDGHLAGFEARIENAGNSVQASLDLDR